MNFSEFKKRLGAEPRSQETDFLVAQQSGPEFRAAAQEAAAFEDKLEAAFAVEAPQGLLEEIVAIPDQVGSSASASHRWRWLAAAAVVVATVGVAGVMVYKSMFYWDSVDDYVVDHWDTDGLEFLQKADGQADDHAASLFARYDIEISPALASHIDFIDACRTPGSRGAHMVISTDQGPVTLIYMPKVETENGHILAFENLVAATLPLERGSAVIIGPNEEVIAPIYAMAREGIRPISRTI